MNDDQVESPTIARRATDAALLIIAVAAVASWLWRRLRRPADVDEAPGDAQKLDDKVGGAVGFPPDNAPV